ncbi:MAG: hypothetical protein L0228_12060 [Planctomycetes bacterium]|nr:hypothetical protein [Planctomycetota bacterium]
MTSDATRADLLKALAELSELHPEWRMGQMLANLATSAGRTDADAIWDLEDYEALTAARRLIERRQKQLASR